MDNPKVVRCGVYFDMQSWFRLARTAYDSSLPDFNPMKLAELYASKNKFQLVDVRLYLAIPDTTHGKFWNTLWHNRIKELEALGCKVFHAPMISRLERTVQTEEFPSQRVLIHSDHDAAVRLCVDATLDVCTNQVDCVVLGTKDPRYSQLVDRLRLHAKMQDKWLKLATMFPIGDGQRAHIGIDRTDWFHVSRADYLECRDQLRRNGTTVCLEQGNDPTAGSTTPQPACDNQQAEPSTN